MTNSSKIYFLISYIFIFSYNYKYFYTNSDNFNNLYNNIYCVLYTFYVNNLNYSFYFPLLVSYYVYS